MGAHRHVAVGHQGRQPAWCPVFQLTQHHFGARKACKPRTIHPPALGNGKAQHCLHRGGVGADVAAVQRQAGFQPQGVSRAQTGRGHARVGQQMAHQRLGLGGGNGDLVAVLAGVARAGGKAGHAQQLQRHGFHEARRAGTRVQRSQHGLGLWALQGDQRGVDPGELQLRAPGGEQVEIVIAVAGVDDDAHLAAQVDEHQVVLDAPAFVQQQRVALGALGPVGEVQRQAGFQLGVQRLDAAIARAHQQLTHVRDIEEPARGAGGQMLGLQAAVLDGHVVAGKAAHAGAQLAVQTVQGNVFQGFSHGALLANSPTGAGRCRPGCGRRPRCRCA